MKKLIYISSKHQAILVTGESAGQINLVKIDLGYVSSSKDNYQQIAAVVNAKFVDVDDIQIAGQDNQPTVNENNRGENDGKE
ncbi:MAG: hypothetical protein HXL05_00895 [Candidatus Nanosynbacter sp.]|nr:hypothetical protein [Candidatus Nanosynbacter sp.]